MSIVGTVKEISGLVQAVDVTGNVRVLILGDAVNADETIIAINEDSKVKIDLKNGREVLLNGYEKSLLDESVSSNESFANTDVQAIQNALLAGEELPEEATAAGDGGAADDGGTEGGFVADRTDERGDLSTYNLDFSTAVNALEEDSPFGANNDQQNTEPEAIDDIGTTDEGVATSGNILINDSDDGLPNPQADLDIVSINGITLTDENGNFVVKTAYGTLILNAESGAYTYEDDYDQLSVGESVTDSFTYAVSDGLLEDTGTLTVTLDGTNDRPVVSDINANKLIDNQSHDIVQNNDGSVGYSYFTVYETTEVTISTDGPTIDPQLFLLKDDGNLSNDDFIAANDDGWTPAGAWNNSIITITLEPGNYVAAVSDYQLSLSEVVAGINDNSMIGTVTLNFSSDKPISVREQEEDIGLNTFEGNVATATDIDNADTHTYAIVKNSLHVDSDLVTNLGITLDEISGNYQIVGDFNALAEGETAVVTFGYTANDGNGFDGTDSINENSTSEMATVTLTIRGTNDAPVIESSTNSNIFDGLNGEYYSTNSHIDNLDEFKSIVNNEDPDATFRATNLTFNQGSDNVGRDENLQNFLGKDASTLSSDPSTTSNGGLHMFGEVYLKAGTYSFQVRADDGYEITIDGNSVAKYESNQGATTRTHDSFSIATDGFYSVDMKWWDQGGAYEFEPVLSFNGESYEVFSADNFDFRAEAPTTVIESGSTDNGNFVEGINTVSGELSASDVDNNAVLTWSVDSPSDTYGVFTIDGQGKWTYDLDNSKADSLSEGEVVTESFTVVVTDEFGATDTQVVSINIQGTNDIPILTPLDDFNATEDGVLISGTVKATDMDSDNLTYSLIGNSPAGLTMDSEGNYTFDPSVNAYESLGKGDTEDISFTWQVSDEYGASVTDTTTITITGVNDAPVANDDGKLVFGGLQGEYYAYEQGLDGANLNSIDQVRSFINSNNADATFVSTEIDYRQVSGSNLAKDDNLQEFLNNDSTTLSNNPDNSGTDGILHITGKLHVQVEGDYTLNAHHDDGFEIKIGNQMIEHNGNTSPRNTQETITLTEGYHDINILYWDQGGQYVFEMELLNSNGQNIWISENLSYEDNTAQLTTNEDTPVTINVLNNDFDIDGDTLNIDSVTKPENGTVVINTDGTITYTPDNNYHGEDSFEYTISDGNGGTDIAQVTLNVLSFNDTPTSENFTSNFEIGRNSIDFDSHISDIEDDASSQKQTSFDITNNPSNGTLTGTTYTPEITTILLGEKGEESRSLNTWGDGSGTSVSKIENEITVTTSSNQGDLKVYDAKQNHIGYGIGDDDGSGLNDNGETITVTFKGGIVASAEVGIDGLGGHFHSDASQDAKAIWIAFRDEQEVARGEVQSPGENPGNSNLFNSVNIIVSGGFDKIEFSAQSTNSGSSYEVRYVEAKVIKTDSFTYKPIDSDGLEGNESEVALNYFDTTLVGSDGNDVLVVESSEIDLSSLAYDSWGSGQDRGVDTLDITDNVIKLSGNNWKAVSLSDLGVTEDFDWSSGKLTFEIKSTDGGEIQGVLFENDALTQQGADSSNAINVFGSQNWGSYNNYTAEEVGDGWTRVEVDLSGIQSGSEDFTQLVFVNDDDNNDPKDDVLGTSQFRNINFSDDSMSVEGGDGYDVLMIEHGTLDLANVSNIEEIHLGNNATLGQLNAQEIFDINDNHEVNITGEGSVALDSNEWSDNGSSVFEAIYDSQTVILNIDDNIQVDII